MSTRLLTLLSASCLAVAANADTLIHKDGRMFDGVEIRRNEDSVTMYFKHGNVVVPLEDVAEVIIEKDDGFVATTDEERERVAKGQVRYKGKWMSKTARTKQVAKDLAAVRERIEKRKEGRLWRNREIVETKNFVFESTTPPEVTERYRSLCEAYFQEFAKTWRIKRGKDVGKLTVKLFVDQENYMQVTGVGRYTLGFFRFIEPYQLCIFYDRLHSDQTEEVMFHEIGHYLQKLIDVEFKYPHFPGEALSEYYGASTWDPVKKRVNFGNILPSRAQEVHYDIAQDEWVSLEDLLTGAPDRTYHDYTWGWSLVHFLMSSKEHSKNFTKFYVALAKGKDVERRPLSYGRTTLKAVSGESVKAAFMKYLKVKDDAELAEIQEDWYEHIRENLHDESARGLEIAAFKNMGQGRDLRAKRLLEEAFEAGSENPHAYYVYAELLDDLDEKAKAREYWEKAVEGDPLVPEYYIALGEHLVENGNQEDFLVGEECLRLALDIEPDNFYLERNLEKILRDGQRRLNKKGQ
jgi:tetratricopeptide (TPR) repeat protein